MDNSEKLYNNVEDIDLIIAGNTNVAGTQGARGEPVQSAGARFAYIGAVVIDKEGNVTDHYLISTEGLDTDPALQKTVDRIKERLGSNVDVASENGIAKIISEYSDEKASAETASDADKSQTKTGTDDKSGADEAEEKTEADDKASDASAAEGKEEGLSLNSDGKYEVVKGDCLWKIAEKHLGDGSRWGEIYELNSNIISNPSLIYIGQQLVLPPG
ncbi:MAG: LysM peptidoglycan-binding domain-containing protein [Lachnospiraceae bacterium]|nr:LysM peptidoglycan-binding domain-containing protein [Lachnospiraceae bacterium]